MANGPDFPVLGGPVCYMDEDATVVVGQGGDFGPTNDPMDDAQFIAHAGTDVPRLLQEVRRLRAVTRGRKPIATIVNTRPSTISKDDAQIYTTR